MPGSRAQYFRDYRAAQKVHKQAHAEYDAAKPQIGKLKTIASQRQDRITELEAEVAHLKRQLAAKSQNTISPFEGLSKPMKVGPKMGGFSPESEVSVPDPVDYHAKDDATLRRQLTFNPAPKPGAKKK